MKIIQPRLLDPVNNKHPEGAIDVNLKAKSHPVTREYQLRPRRLQYHKTDGHWNVEGHRHVADVLAEAIRAGNYLRE